MSVVKIGQISKLGEAMRAGGFTLFELIVTMTILGVLVMGTIPLAQNAVKREKEMRLRETLRECEGDR